MAWIGFSFYNKKIRHWASFDYKLIHYDKDFKEIKTYIERMGIMDRLLK
jgi:hypothetical protein